MSASSLLFLLGAGSYSGVPTPSLDACDGKVCQVGGNPGCGTGSGCADTGEQHRIGWNHTDCNDSYHHVAIHVSVDGGGYTEMVDDLSCDRAEDDDGCCEFGSIKLPITYEGNYQRVMAYSSDMGTCTTTYQYRVRIETDGTDTAIDTCTEAASNTGCDETCIQ